jgi:hypothetical protein
MTFTEIQHEIEQWEPALQRRLMAYLAALQLRAEGLDGQEIARRLNDGSPENWVSLNDAKKRLLSES